MELAPTFKPFFVPALFSAVLCGALCLPTFADEPVAPAADASSHQYMFQSHQVPAPGGGTSVYVRLSDSFDPGFNRRILYILDDAGRYTRMERAQKVAERLQKACDADPHFIDTILPPASVGSEIVLKLKSQASDPGSFIITADRDSMRSANASTREQYAQMIITAIRDRLKGIKLRDAAFDYDLKTSEDRNKRAVEYFDQAQEAYEDKDRDVAISKCEVALKLEPNYDFCRLRLADLYAEAGQKGKARELYARVAFSDANVADKKVAASRLKGLGNG